MGLRVVTTEGGPVRFRHAAIRAALGMVDFFITSGAAAVISVLATRNNQRLGDLVAGTVVLRERTGLPPPQAAEFSVPPGLESYAASLDVSGMTADDYRAVRAFLLRAPGLDYKVRYQLAIGLADPLSDRVRPMPPAGVHPAWYLICVAAVYQHRTAPRPATPWSPSAAAPPPPVAPAGARSAPASAASAARGPDRPGPGPGADVVAAAGPRTRRGCPRSPSVRRDPRRSPTPRASAPPIRSRELRPTRGGIRPARLTPPEVDSRVRPRACVASGGARLSRQRRHHGHAGGGGGGDAPLPPGPFRQPVGVARGGAGGPQGAGRGPGRGGRRPGGGAGRDRVHRRGHGGRQPGRRRRPPAAGRGGRVLGGRAPRRPPRLRRPRGTAGARCPPTGWSTSTGWRRCSTPTSPSCR